MQSPPFQENRSFSRNYWGRKPVKDHSHVCFNGSRPGGRKYHPRVVGLSTWREGVRREGVVSMAKIRLHPLASSKASLGWRVFSMTSQVATPRQSSKFPADIVTPENSARLEPPSRSFLFAEVYLSQSEQF
jgi:hypothetical protein